MSFMIGLPTLFSLMLGTKLRKYVDPTKAVQVCTHQSNDVISLKRLLYMHVF